MYKTSPTIRSLFIVAFYMSSSGCTVGPNFKTPDPPKVESYTEQPVAQRTVATPDLKGGEAQEFKFNQEIPAEWWELFHSPQLNALIERGFKNNPDMKAAEATLYQAEEDLRALIGFTLYPNINANVFAGREQLSAFQSLEGTPNTQQSQFPRQILTMYNANVSVSYVFDIFGRNRRAIEALQSQIDFEAFQLEATYLTLAGNIVTTAITEASLRAQIHATQEIIKMEEKQLQLTKKRFDIGSVTDLDVLAQETVLAQASATLPPLEDALAQTRHALAVLVGSYPGDADLPVFELDNLHLPQELPVSLPSTLIRQRPDIRAAEALLHQASAEIGVATANMLPSFPIVASYGPLSDTLSNFFGKNNISWAWQANVLQPIFNGGALSAQRESAIAAFKAAFADYEQTVLTGLQNVADSLSALENDAQELQETAKAEKAAKRALELTEKRYKLGGATYLDIIIAELFYQQTYIARINAQGARYVDTAALFQALGGGWWNRETEE